MTKREIYKIKAKMKVDDTEVEKAGDKLELLSEKLKEANSLAKELASTLKPFTTSIPIQINEKELSDMAINSEEF